MCLTFFAINFLHESQSTKIQMSKFSLVYSVHICTLYNEISLIKNH